MIVHVRIWFRALPYALAWAVGAALIGGFAWYEVERDRAGDLAAARRDLANMSALLAEHVQRKLETAERELEIARIVYGHDGDLPHPAAPDGQGDDRNTVAVVDAAGDLVVATNPAVSRDFHVGDREYFIDARERSDGALVVGSPIVSRLSRRWAVPVALRINDAAGHFAGAAIVAIDPRALLDVDRAFDNDADGYFGLLHGAGTLVAKSRLAVLDASASVPDDVFAHELAFERDLVDFRIDWRSLGGVQHLVVFRHVAPFPLWVFASEEREFVYAGSGAFRDGLAATSIAAIVALALPLMVLARRRMQLERKHDVLQGRFADEQDRARLDPLTGVANRLSFEEHLAAVHSVLAQRGTPFVLVAMDLDRFKSLNDTRGHGEGDRALRRFGALLAGLVRRDDSVARLGGDEFALLMPGADLAIARRVLDSFRDLFRRETATERWRIGFSAAAVRFPRNLSKIGDYLEVCDRHLYAVKRDGGDSNVYFDHARGG